MTLREELYAELITEAYAECRLLIYRITHTHASKFRIPYEDLLSEAHIIFVRACQSYKAQHGARLITWVYWKVNLGLMDYAARHFKHYGHAELDEAPERAQSPSDFFLFDLMNQTQGKTRKLAKILAKENSGFAKLCKWSGAKTRGSIIKVLRNHLLDIGWGNEDIDTTFQELKAVLFPVEKEPEKMSKKDFWLYARTGLDRLEMKKLALCYSKTGMTPAQIRRLQST